MIRFLIGIVIIFGAVGADDFAHEAGLIPPSLWETAGWCALGIALMLWALPKLTNNQQ
jgi:hypothetical protein|tara:strand:+ start:662 stop:835 length:174 start_codon:yes stop_codon:yes gene_type:complete